MSMEESIAAAVVAALREEGLLPSTTGIRPRLLTLAQAAEYLGRTKAAVRGLITAGTLVTTNLDRRIFLDIRDLDQAIQNAKGTNQK